MKPFRLRVFGASVVGLALVAAACGGDDSGGSATSGTVDENVKTAVSDAISGSSTPGTGATATTVKDPTTIEEAEALWKTQREAIVKRIKENKWGKSADGKTVTGPEGFTIDLTKCPAGWSDTEGLTDTAIKLGYTTAQSGTLADYGVNITKAWQIYFENESNKGSFTDSKGKKRTLNLLARDDGYDPARTIPLVDELIDSEKVFAQVTLGSGNTMKTYDKLNQRCIPQPFSQTGHPAWGDPVNHPWTTGLQLAYNTEAVLWGAFIEKNLDELTKADGKVTVGALIMNNDFGKSYDGGFKAWLAQTSVKDKVEYITEVIEPSAPTIKDPMTTLASKNPEIFIAMTAGTSCTQAITEAAENGMKENVKYLFQPSVCVTKTFVGKDAVGGDGSATNGWYIVNGGTKDITAVAYDNDYYAKFFRESLAAKGVDYKASGSLGTGYSFGWAMIQAFEIAGMLDGGLTRTNLILAIRSMDMTSPTLLPGLKFNMNGNKDAYFIEGGIFQKYDSAKQAWADQGTPIELSGKSKACAWDQSAGLCK